MKKLAVAACLLLCACGYVDRILGPSPTEVRLIEAQRCQAIRSAESRLEALEELRGQITDEEFDERARVILSELEALKDPAWVPPS